MSLTFRPIFFAHELTFISGLAYSVDRIFFADVAVLFIHFLFWEIFGDTR